MPSWEDLKEREKEICRGLGIVYHDYEKEDRDFYEEQKQDELMFKMCEEEMLRRFKKCDKILNRLLGNDFNIYIESRKENIDKQKEYKEYINNLSDSEIDDLPF